jgi:transposase InsO family protein
VKYRFIRRQAESYPVRQLCRVLGVSASGYYAWRGRPPSARQQANQELVKRMRQLHKGPRRVYGSPRMHNGLRQAGVRCSLNRVARLMRQHGIKARRRRHYIVTTESGGTWRAAPNLLARRFQPGQVRAWMADLTYVSTYEGELYLTVVIKLQSRRVIGWSMGNTPSGQLALDALKMALNTAKLAGGELHHSDRGGHYTSNAYKALIAANGMTESMSRKGDCWDNAVVESFFATLKCECLYQEPLRTRAQARQKTFEFIEVFYNKQRAHSALGYLSPEEYEKLHNVP